MTGTIGFSINYYNLSVLYYAHMWHKVPEMTTVSFHDKLRAEFTSTSRFSWIRRSLRCNESDRSSASGSTPSLTIGHKKHSYYKKPQITLIHISGSFGLFQWQLKWLYMGSTCEMCTGTLIFNEPLPLGLVLTSFLLLFSLFLQLTKIKGQTA